MSLRTAGLIALYLAAMTPRATVTEPRAHHPHHTARRPPQ
jgi:hypothetical protein